MALPERMAHACSGQWAVGGGHPSCALYASLVLLNPQQESKAVCATWNNVPSKKQAPGAPTGYFAAAQMAELSGSHLGSSISSVRKVQKWVDATAPVGFVGGEAATGGIVFVNNSSSAYVAIDLHQQQTTQ